jgi:hypothetical protein
MDEQRRLELSELTGQMPTVDAKAMSRFQKREGFQQCSADVGKTKKPERFPIPAFSLLAFQRFSFFLRSPCG